VTLSWAHYVELLSIKDEKERQFYLQHAAMEEWSRDTLRKAIQKDFFTLEKSRKTLPAGEVTLERGGDPLHIYKAIVESVVDGDTLLTRIDLGFNVWISQRVRFRGINTAELIRNGVKTGAAPDRADQAKAFVEERLKGIEFVVIKTYKTDMYGRYVADVFYHPTIKKKEEVYAKGFFLNMELLSKGLADPMS
jgi:endonuclease YncB( thermonuclease family)